MKWIHCCLLLLCIAWLIVGLERADSKVEGKTKRLKSQLKEDSKKLWKDMAWLAQQLRNLFHWVPPNGIDKYRDEWDRWYTESLHGNRKQANGAWAGLLSRVGKLALYARLYKRWTPDIRNGESGFYWKHPQPHLSFLDDQGSVNCRASLRSCIDYFWSRLDEYSELYWLHAPFFQNAERKKQRPIVAQFQHTSGTHGLPFLRRRNITHHIWKYQFATTMQYYMCWFTLNRLPLFAYLPYCDYDIKAGYVADWEEIYARSKDDRVVLDKLTLTDEKGRHVHRHSFFCAQYSFCPDPCCGRSSIHSDPDCLLEERNPCEKETNPECELKGSLNADFVAGARNDWNVSCLCDEAGFEYVATEGRCVDINECTAPKGPCPEAWENGLSKGAKSKEKKQSELKPLGLMRAASTNGASAASTSEAGKLRQAYRYLRHKSLSLLSDSSDHELTSSSSAPARSRLSKSRQEETKDDADTKHEEVDPVYLAIKQAGELYQKSRSSSGPPKKASSARSSAADLRKQDSLGSRGSLSSGAGTGPVRDSDPSLGLRVGSQPGGNGGGNGGGPGSQELRPGGPGGPGKQRHPQLHQGMKSLSLDSPDATPYTLNLAKHRAQSKNARSASPNPKTARLLSAPKLVKNCSIETDETDYTSASASPCPSPYDAGSSSSLGLGGLAGGEPVGWVATRDYRQRFPEDLGLIAGQIVNVLDSSDPDWLHGSKPGDDHIGIFPVTCVGRIYAGERVAQIVQNLTLSHPPRHIRLYKDQIVFTHGDVGEDGNIAIRTEKGYKATCPVQYMTTVSPS